MYSNCMYVCMYTLQTRKFKLFDMLPMICFDMLPNTSQIRANTSQHEPDTTQHEPDTTQHEPDTTQYEPDTTQHYLFCKIIDSRSKYLYGGQSSAVVVAVVVRIYKGSRAFGLSKSRLMPLFLEDARLLSRNLAP